MEVELDARAVHGKTTLTWGKYELEEAPSLYVAELLVWHFHDEPRRMYQLVEWTAAGGWKLYPSASGG